MSEPSPLSLRLYRAGTHLLYPAAARLLAHRLRQGKEDPTRVGEKRGEPGLPRPEGALIWLHGASVGEMVSLLPLVARLASRATVLLTTGTLTSARVAAQRLPPGALHQFAPLDLPDYVARFLDHWRPDLAIFAESELWPNVVMAARQRGVPLALVNARLSERSFARWRRLPGLIGTLLASFSLCLAQSEGDAERLRASGARAAEALGNLKFDVPPLPADPAALAALTHAIGDRPVLLAASTHEGEEAMVAAAHAEARAGVPGLLTIIAPRHPQRGDEVQALLTGLGLATARRSTGALPEAGTDLYLADTIGETGVFFRAAPVTFLGGSLVPVGGHNPVEPAQLGTALLHGPHVRNNADVFRAFAAAEAALQITDAATLAGSSAQLLRDDASRKAMVARAAGVVARHAGAAERTLAALEPLLARLPSSAR